MTKLTGRTKAVVAVLGIVGALSLGVATDGMASGAAATPKGDAVASNVWCC